MGVEVVSQEEMRSILADKEEGMDPSPSVDVIIRVIGRDSEQHEIERIFKLLIQLVQKPRRAFEWSCGEVW